jgi:hypothetical protein
MQDKAIQIDTCAKGIFYEHFAANGTYQKMRQGEHQNSSIFKE